MKNKRENGYYWVRWYADNEWTIGEWNDTFWLLTGNEDIFSDKSFTEIIETPIPEPK